MEKRLLTLGEAAQYLGHSPHTLRHWIGEGRLEHIRLGRKIVFDPKSLERLINSHRVKERGYR